MKKFEIGKTYSDGEGIEIEVIKRTDKTVTFRFSKPNWFETDMYSEFRKKVSFERHSLHASPALPWALCVFVLFFSDRFSH